MGCSNSTSTYHKVLESESGERIVSRDTKEKMVHKIGSHTERHQR